MFNKHVPLHVNAALGRVFLSIRAEILEGVGTPMWQCGMGHNAYSDVRPTPRTSPSASILSFDPPVLRSNLSIPSFDPFGSSRPIGFLQFHHGPSFAFLSSQSSFLFFPPPAWTCMKRSLTLSNLEGREEER
jgi:hypothetical protein